MESELSELVHHPRYNRKSLRVLLSREEIEVLPVKIASREEIWKAMQGVFFNPDLLYPSEMSLLDGEVGYDDAYRYVRDDGA